MIEKFGSLDGQDIQRATLNDGDVSVSVLNYGAVTQDWRVPLGGKRVPVVLGFERFEHYPKYSRSFGIIAGRVANRTALGRFELDGTTYQLPTNNGKNHLHGGNLGLGRRIWSMETDGERAVQLTYHSPDGEEGYPGRVDFKVTVALEGHSVTYEFEATPDRASPINLAQHSYYNLGDSSVLEHELWMASAHYTPVDAELIPTGEIEPVAGHHFDFSRSVKIGAHPSSRDGIDLNLVLDPARDVTAPAAIAKSAAGLELKLWTDQPGIQVFNGPNLNVPVPGLDGQRYGAFAGLCLEAQKFPDALNKPDFPSVISTPDTPYYQKLRIEIR